MTNGWYRIIRTDGTLLVEWVQNNHSKSGSVRSLTLEGATYEEVEVLNRREMNERITNALRMA